MMTKMILRPQLHLSMMSAAFSLVQLPHAAVHASEALAEFGAVLLRRLPPRQLRL